MNDETNAESVEGDELPALAPPAEPAWLSADRESFAEHEKEASPQVEEAPEFVEHDYGDRKLTGDDVKMYDDFIGATGCGANTAGDCHDWLNKNAAAFGRLVEKTGDLQSAYGWARDSMLAQGIAPADVQAAILWFDGQVRKQVSGHG